MDKRSILKWNELEPLCVLRLILRNLWLVVLAGLIGYLLSSAFLTGDVSRSYSSSATFVVTPQDSTSYYSSLASSATSAKTYAALLESSIMNRVAAAALGGTSSGTITASQLGETNLISVTVTASTPKDALLMMQAVTEHYGELSQYVSSSAMLSVLNTPSLSTLVSSTFNSHRLTRYATVGCAGLMVAILLLIAMCTGTVQNIQAAKNRLDAKILGSIPHEKRLGMRVRGPRRSRKRLNITSPNVTFAFAESIYRIAAKFEQEKAKGRTVYLLTSVSESEGKSTVAANVALSLAMKKVSVLFMDLDLRRPVQAQNLEIELRSEQELGAMLAAKLDPQQILAQVQTDHPSGLKTLLSKKSYQNAAELICSRTLADVIDLARQQYDYVIVDLPPMGYFSEGEAMMDLSDASLLVVRQDVVPAMVINDNIDALRAGKAEFLGCVLNDMNSLFSARSAYGYDSKRYGKYGYGYGYGYHRSSQDESSTK